MTSALLCSCITFVHELPDVVFRASQVLVHLRFYLSTIHTFMVYDVAPLDQKWPPNGPKRWVRSDSLHHWLQGSVDVLSLPLSADQQVPQKTTRPGEDSGILSTSSPRGTRRGELSKEAGWWAERDRSDSEASLFMVDRISQLFDIYIYIHDILCMHICICVCVCTHAFSMIY